MLRLRTMLASLCCFGAYLTVAGTQNLIFQLSDVDSRDYKIADLVIEYPDGKVTDGFRILDGNRVALVRWSAIDSLEIGALVGDGTPNKHLECSVRLSDGSNHSLSCVDGIVMGKTRNGDYKKPLDQVTALIPLK